MRAISPSLWFDHDAEEAVSFYTSLFPDSSPGAVLRGPDGAAIALDFTLFGREFNAINGGPQFPFTEAVSFVIECDSQEEVDHYWERLTDGGEESQCGWLKDRFGLSWQVVPTEFLRLSQDPNPAKVKAVMDVMLTQVKLELAPIRAAYDAA